MPLELRSHRVNAPRDTDKDLETAPDRQRDKAKRRKDMDEKRIEKLYDLLERAKREKDRETEAALRWAIFTLESGR